MTRDEAITPVELTPLEDAIATAIYDYQRSVGLDDEAAGEDAFGIMRAVHTVIQQAFAERDGEIERLRDGLEQSLQGWENVAELNLIPGRYMDGAIKLAKVCRQALAAKGDSRG